MQFSELGLSAEIVRAVHAQGYTHPTPIQLQAIPAVLKGGDLLAGAQTGTGKTAGFTLPLLHRLSTQARMRQVPAAQPTRAAGTRHGGARAVTPPVRALVMAPTRELAIQVEESVAVYGKYTGLKSMAMFGGVGMQPQIDRLRAGVDILVATPGRLLDHHQQGTLNLSEVEILVLDEADRMLDMGFIHDIRKVLALLPESRQNLLFSATFSDDIKRLATGLLKQPAIIEVARRNTTVETVEQTVHPVARESKRALLAHLINSGDWHQVLVFTRTKHGANRLAEQLDRDGITAMAIHGNKSQGARVRALGGFKDGTVRVLVATDIAARGIDIDQLPHVVNYDLPNVSEDYVHRIGRTGRAGATGEARSLVCADDLGFLADIEKLIGRKLQREVIPGFEPNPDEVAEPVLRGRNDRGGRPGRPGPEAGRSSAAAKTGRPSGETAKRPSGEAAKRPSGTGADGRRNAAPARAAQPSPQRSNTGAQTAQPRTGAATGEGNGNPGRSRRRRRSGSRPGGGATH